MPAGTMTIAATTPGIVPMCTGRCPSTCCTSSAITATRSAVTDTIATGSGVTTITVTGSAVAGIIAITDLTALTGVRH